MYRQLQLNMHAALLRRTAEEAAKRGVSPAVLFSKFGNLLRDHSILDQIRSLETDVDHIEEKLYKDIFLMDLDLPHQMQLSNYVESLCDLWSQS